MRDLGTPEDRFRRAVNAGTGEALELVGLMAKDGVPRYGRAAARWVALVTDEQDLGMGDARALLAIVALLPQTPELMTTLRRRVHRPGTPR